MTETNPPEPQPTVTPEQAMEVLRNPQAEATRACGEEIAAVLMKDGRRLVVTQDVAVVPAG